MGQTIDGIRSTFLRVLVRTIGINHFSSFVHTEAIRLQQARAQADLVTYLGVANAAADSLEAALPDPGLESSGRHHASPRPERAA